MDFRAINAKLADLDRPTPATPNTQLNEAKTVVAEKAVSKAQQKAAGAALAAKKGDAPKKDLKDASKEMMKMSKAELEKIAGTKHKGLPEKVKEASEKKCNHTAEGKKCPVHGLKECGSMYETVELVDDFEEVVEAKKSAAQKKAQEKFKAMVKGKTADDKDSMDESSHADDEAEAKKKKEEKKKKIAKIMDEGSKPDFLDMDKDGDKKEPMKKAVADKKKKKTVKESVETKLTFKDMIKLVQESGGQQQIDPVDTVLWNWAQRVAAAKVQESHKAEIFAGLIYERNGGTFEMYDVLAEQK